MSCNYPMLARPDGLTSSGKIKYKMYGRYDSSLLEDYPDAIKLPCGKCIGCRAQKTREWADRMILELDHSKKAVFLTLTYNDDHLPVKYQVTTGQCEMTLQKRDLTLFMKRLRKQFRDVNLKFYAVGEYGSRTQRPHFHLILYGVSKEDFNIVRSEKYKDGDEVKSRDVLISHIDRQGQNELGQLYYKCDWLAENVWKNGFCLLSDVSWNTCAYVARYIKKKDYGFVSDEFVDRVREPEYSVMSRNPGIGLSYLTDHPECVDYSKFHLGDQNGMVEVCFPKAFLRRLEISDPDKFEQLKKERAAAASDAEINRLANTDLSSMELDELSENRITRSGEVIDFYRGL